MPRRFYCLSAVVLLSTIAAAAPALSPDRAISVHADQAFTTVGFSIVEFGVMKQDGAFRDFSGDVFYDPAHPERSHVNFTVQVASLDARSHTRERVVLSDDFFDAQRFPTMAFTSTSVTRADENTLQVTGDITIRGVTRRITVPVRYLGTHDLGNESHQTFAGFETTFTIDRTAFGVNGSRWSGGKALLSKDVTVHMTVGGQVH